VREVPRKGEDSGETLESALVVRPTSGRQVRLALAPREFDILPLRDGPALGRGVAIGPRAMFEAHDGKLPDVFELISIADHPKLEAVIVRRARFRLLERERLAALIVRHADALMHEPPLVEVELAGAVSVRVELES
jgi:hypothetical protein